MFIRNVASLAHFDLAKMGKSPVAQSEFLFAGLNSFEPGQEHAPHAHPGQDKLYLILEGTGVIQIGSEQQQLASGDAALAPSGVLHSIRNPGPQRLVVLAILAPGPAK